MVYINPQHVLDEKTSITFENIRQRGHVYVSGVYLKKESPIVIYCPEHDQKHTTTFSNYNRSLNGMPCCGNASRSALLTGRVFSKETLEKMRIANSQRPDRGGQPRRWRENAKYRSWREHVLSLWDDRCCITSAPENLVVHHLISAHSCYHLIYEPHNGIVITKKLHALFHDHFGYKNNTVDQFSNFLDLLCQSSSPLCQNQKRFFWIKTQPRRK